MHQIAKNADRSIIRLWEEERLNRFPNGRRAIWRAGDVLVTYFDQVEYFRRVHGLGPSKMKHWPAITEFFGKFGQSFLIDLHAADGPAFEKPLELLYRNTLVCMDIRDHTICERTLRPGEGWTIMPVGAHNISIFSEIYLTCFEANSTPREIAQENINSLLGLAGWHPWLVKKGDQFAGCYALFMRGDTALLSSSATLPAFRNLGLQKLMIAYRLSEAQTLGAVNAVSQGFTGGPSVANLIKLGFSESHEKLTYRYRFTE